MSQAPTQVILAAFKTEDAADKALQQLKEAKKQHLIAIDNVAVLRMDQQGKLHVSEPTDMGAGRGAAIGGVVGGVIGLVAGPVGWAALGGAALGGVLARWRDSGFEDERLRKLGQNLQPGTSAILAVIEHTWVTELEAELEQAGADVLTAELGADIAEQLKSGHQVAYTAVATSDAIAVARATDAPADSAEKTEKAEQPAVEAPAATTTEPPASTHA